jgi:UDP-N-acetylglucosamine 1-carboxyvinyltransferase
MEKNSSYFKIKQSLYLNGTIMVDGAKNSLLPIIIASILTKGISYIHGVPDIHDLHSTIYLLSLFNVHALYNKKEQVLSVDSTYIKNNKMSANDFKLLRTSILFAAPLLHHFNEFWLSHPGGDSIGKRPVDIHLDGLQACGIVSASQEEYTYLVVQEPSKNVDFYLPFPSVGATQNLLLYGACNEGTITLYNAAQEPEIIELIDVLKMMGASIQCFFGGTIRIQGQKNLKPFSYHIMPDRIEAATFLIAAAITGGSIFLPNACAHFMRPCLALLEKCGHTIEVGRNGFGITCIGAERSAMQQNNSLVIKTLPYPGFSTDYQPLFLPLLALANGSSVIHENIFENRFLCVDGLNKMGAQISLTHGSMVTIDGVEDLTGQEVCAGDIRSGASFILAALAASGKTSVYGVEHILRGYSAIDAKLQSVGADIILEAKEEVLMDGNYFVDYKKDFCEVTI